VLAAATRAARRERLDPPIPISFRFRDAPATQEDEWQELVIRDLGLPSWERLQLDGYDYFGAASAAGLRRHGVLFPPNAFLHRPAFAAAVGGSVLTGLGGDNLLGGWRWCTLADAPATLRRPPALLGVLTALQQVSASRSWIAAWVRSASGRLDPSRSLDRPWSHREAVRSFWQ